MHAILTMVVLGICLMPGHVVAQAEARESLKLDAVNQLQRKLAERETEPNRVESVTNVGTGRTLTFEEIEDLYVDGKITARQFQTYVNALRSPAPVTVQPHPLAPEVQEKALELLRKHSPDPASNPAPGPAITIEQIDRAAPIEASPVEQSIADDFEAIVIKMDELIKSKEEREKERAAESNPEVLDEEGKTKSKRQRLNDLLLLHVHGKLSKEEYEKRRAVVIAEPE